MCSFAGGPGGECQPLHATLTVAVTLRLANADRFEWAGGRGTLPMEV
ncbi:MAG: hypothetical protein KGI88_01125 [Betaproteobacteria bacterium]|nr:hypothetical protein [Betaproteobacteria bacterium]MDE2055818.1 hypothetical protein [Betaproteobacteria bacterium]